MDLLDTNMRDSESIKQTGLAVKHLRHGTFSFIHKSVTLSTTLLSQSMSQKITAFVYIPTFESDLFSVIASPVGVYRIRVVFISGG